MGWAGGLPAAIERELAGLVLRYFRHAEMAGSAENRRGGDEFKAGSLIAQSHNAAQCKSRPGKSKTKMPG
jgi:hypothetical protein